MSWRFRGAAVEVFPVVYGMPMAAMTTWVRVRFMVKARVRARVRARVPHFVPCRCY